MSRNTTLRSLLIVFVLGVTTVLLSAVRPLAAETADFSLNVQVQPAGSGTVQRNPGPPYSENQVVTLTATPAAGYLFDKWVQVDDIPWWDAGWDYRVEVTAAATGTARKDKPAEIAVNFTQIWNSLGVTGVTFDPNSVRVVEIDDNNAVIDDTVPFQFDKATDYNATTKAAGTVVLIMEGNTPAGASRSYHVYFDVTGKGFTPPNVPAQITLTDNIKDEGTWAYQIATPTGTYFLQKPFGALSSFNDVNGNDWIAWSTATGAAGQFRGIPNAGGPTNDGIFHPGLNANTNTSKWEMTPTLRGNGPIKVTVHFIETKAAMGRSKWEGMFEFYPGYAVFTMLHAAQSEAKDYPYWFLYEGTPGGVLEANSDFVMRPSGVQTVINTAWSGDLPLEEWIYVGDPTAGRSLFLTNGIDDTKIDSWTLDGAKQMTIFGFGRDGGNALLENGLLPRKFTFGLMNETLLDNAKPVIYNAYHSMNTSVGQAQSRVGASLGSANPLEFTVTGEHTIVAHFKPAQYTLTVNVDPAGTGTVTKTPNKATYNFGEQVTLAAAPTAGGYNFAGWTGDATGTQNPLVVTMDGNKNITAPFAQSFTVTLTADPTAGGSVNVNPSKPTYQPGEQITITATPNSGYTFTGWTGDLTSNSTIETLTVNSNLNIVGHFGQAQYTFNATSGGNGTVSWEPNKASYAAGEVITATATAAQGFTFANWTGSVSSTVNPLVYTINGNAAVQANFVPIQFYTLTVTVPSGGGTVTKEPDQATYASGTVVTLTAVPDTGKRFVQWGGAASGTEPTTTVTMTSNLAVTATFEDDLHPLMVTIIPLGAGNVSLNPAGGNYPAGTTVTMTATANPGYVFLGWGGAAGGTTNPTTVEVPEGGTAVIANFEALGPFTLTVDPAGNGTGTVQINPDKAEYSWNETVTLTAVPGDGSVFAGWAGAVTSNANPLTIKMDSDKVITANFIEPSGPFSDNFNMCSLDAMWGTPINPSGLATFVTSGTDLRITLPEGVEHNVWKDGNFAARVMQDADNTDLQLVAKFDSALTQNSQIQGILVEGMNARYLRFDFNYTLDANNEGVITAYAATFDNNKPSRKIAEVIDPAAARYLRVTREENSWTMAYSPDGVAWTDAGSFNWDINVNATGVFAGNVSMKGSPAPAHTAIIDYFQNVANGPMAEDAPMMAVTVVGGGTVSANPPLDQLTCGQTVTLTAAPGLGWTFGEWSGDATGENATVSVLLTRPRAVTATFIASDTYYVLLPSIIR